MTTKPSGDIQRLLNRTNSDYAGFGHLDYLTGDYRAIASVANWVGEAGDLAGEEALQARDEAKAAADRAEAARDAAQLNAGIYEDTTAGLAATTDGDYFSVPSDDSDEYLILYRNDNGSAEEVKRYPSAARVENETAARVEGDRVATDLASKPGLLHGEFYDDDDDEQPVYSIIDEDGQALASWNRQGEMDAAPSIDMAEKFQRARAEFHTHDDQPAFALTDEDGRPLYAVDENGQPIVPWITEFHSDDGDLKYCYTDSQGVVFLAWRQDGRFVVGGGGGLDAGSMPTSPQDLPPDQFWLDQERVRSSRSYGDLFTVAHDTLFPSHTDMYSYLDGLVSEYSDYLSKNLLGTDEWGNEIVEYVAMPPGNSPHARAYPDSTIRPPKVLLIGSTHGDEWHSAIANVILLEDMCRRWKEDEVLDALRWGCELRLLPILTPSGWDANSRTNANGVDINRNFPTAWGSGNSGPEPLSENESQICVGWVNDHLDAIALVDHHRNRNLNNDQFCWVSADRPDEIGIAMQHVQDMSAWCRRTWDFVPKDNRTLTLVADNFPGSVARHFSATTPIKSYLLESPRDITGAPQPITRRQIAYRSVKTFIRLLFDQERRKRQDNFEIIT